MDKKKLADAIRILSMDGVQKANSGHPGAPMGMADIAEVLFRRTMRYNPKNPSWENRDRFVLSNGHASMLLYSLLHLTGFDVSLDDLKQFRQLGSITPGHPECDLTPGVETTTGPLGQGFANAVGMALAEAKLAATFNKKDFPLVDHYTYAFVGDGCLMEGISHEAASLAGTWKLNKLITMYDSNGISIDGEITDWFTDDTAQRFSAYGWHVISDVDGHDPHAIGKAIARAKSNTDQPTLIICNTIIGFGSPHKQGKASSHGSPLGDEEVSLARKQLGWKYEERFYVPDEMYEDWDFSKQGAEFEKEWNELFAEYKMQYPEDAAEFERRIGGSYPDGWEEKLDATIAKWQADKLNVASRKASQMVLDQISALMPELLGGSADLTPSNLTQGKGSESYDIEENKGGYLHFGVREFGMMAILNGVALHGGFVPYGGTFLMFMEYARNAIRMAAIMHLPVIQVFTHDSIGLGEDGPTHQAVEQAASLRMTPNMVVWRPADAVESAVAWKGALKRKDGPTSLLLSRQNLVPQDRTEKQVEAISRGGYVLWESKGEPEIILIGTGSELDIAMQAAKRLDKEGRKVRVVSMPSCEVFEAQDLEYRESVLPNTVRKRVAVEAAWADYWFKYVGLDGKIIGMRSFGASAPADDLYEHFHITADAVYEAALSLK
ncbi:MAG: transketolase [Sphaerochaeta sp.]|nr:transketolase [Sphaerochaeta sp.]